MEENTTFDSRLNLTELSSTVQQLKNNLSKIIVGQTGMIDQLIIAILSGGHVLIEGVPGVAKTLTARLLAKSISADFSRIQFTPDLMPSDVTGTSVFNMSKSVFEFNKGPIFANIVLIDEINRAPAKTQAALFEVMQEQQVTVDGHTYQINSPFVVFATQNPIEQEGTYRLPEAQLDRFLFKILVDYPTPDEEVAILELKHANKGKSEVEQIDTFLTKEQIADLRTLIRQVVVEAPLMKYIAEIVSKTRNNRHLILGASPRASIGIMESAKAFAAIQGRDFVTPSDIQAMVFPVLRHRVILSPEKEMEGATPEDIIKQILKSIEVPR